CSVHKPALEPNQRDGWQIVRFRFPLGSEFSKRLADDTSDALNLEKCESRLLGGEGACMYYLSRLTGVDQFAAWSDDFIENVRTYVLEQTKGAAACYRSNKSFPSSVGPFFDTTFS